MNLEILEKKAIYSDLSHELRLEENPKLEVYEGFIIDPNEPRGFVSREEVDAYFE